MKRSTLVMILLMLTWQNNSFAQTVTDSTSSAKENYLKIYLDGLYEYSDYIKQHVTYVNYVRDRFEADVHLLVTSQNTGSGGSEYTLFYLGQNRFEGKTDTFKYIANTNNTDDETRQGLTEILKLGLIRYGGVSLIHNQLNLAKYGATDEELLTQQKELSTSYSYFASFGISYTFGSIFNNVVNPRFGQE